MARGLAKGIRQMGRGFYYRVRHAGKETLVPLGTDPDKALVKALETRKKIKQGKPLVEMRTAVTVSTAARQWLAEYVAHARSDRFAKETESRVDRFLLPFMGQERIEDVTARTLFAYRNFLAEQTRGDDESPRHLSAGTIRHALGEIRALLNYCLNVGILDRSPIPTRGWMPRLPERAPEPFATEECRALAAVPGDHGRVLRFMLATGIRWGEMTRAQAKDIREGVLVIRKSKSGKVRRVPVPAEIIAEQAGRVGRLCPFSDSISFNRRVRSLSGIRRFHSHLARHTFATHWLESGGSLSGLKAVLGHSSVSVTEQYGRIGDDLVMREARRLEEHRKAAIA